MVLFKKGEIMFYLYALIVSLFLSGCASNGFSEYYTPYAQDKVAPTDHVDIIQYKNDNELLDKMEEGYRILGSSNFKSSGGATLEQLKSQAKSIGSDVAMVNSSYAGSESYVMPIMNYTPGTTSTTYSNASAYGNTGYANAYGTSTTYNPGTYSTSYIPATRNWTSYKVIYLKKFDPNKWTRSGIWVVEKTTELNKKMGTNSGCLIQLVYKNTPAYNNDIFRGDVIMKVNGSKIRSCKDINFKNKKNVSLELWRDGKTVIIKNMKLNQID